MCFRFYPVNVLAKSIVKPLILSLWVTTCFGPLLTSCGEGPSGDSSSRGKPRVGNTDKTDSANEKPASGTKASPTPSPAESADDEHVFSLFDWKGRSTSGGYVEKSYVLYTFAMLKHSVAVEKVYLDGKEIVPGLDPAQSPLVFPRTVLLGQLDADTIDRLGLSSASDPEKSRLETEEYRTLLKKFSIKHAFFYAGGFQLNLFDGKFREFRFVLRKDDGTTAEVTKTVFYSN
jgi:hypothetical protein